MAIRFHLDEHVAPAVAVVLRRHQIDVTTSQEAGLLGESDVDQLSFATSQGRVPVTCDLGFLREEVVSNAQFGICFCRPQKYSIGEFARALLTVATCMRDDEMRAHVEWL
jgi:predicted nuclease of predicted toxin-antitoxin system